MTCRSETTTNPFDCLLWTGKAASSSWADQHQHQTSVVASNDSTLLRHFQTKLEETKMDHFSNLCIWNFISNTKTFSHICTSVDGLNRSTSSVYLPSAYSCPDPPSAHQEVCGLLKLWSVGEFILQPWLRWIRRRRRNVENETKLLDFTWDSGKRTIQMYWYD